MCKEGEESLHFYKQETVQQIIGYQWHSTTQYVLKMLFTIYMFMFVIPYILVATGSQFGTDNQAILLMICNIPQYLLFMIELTQISHQGFSYF